MTDQQFGIICTLIYVTGFFNLIAVVSVAVKLDGIRKVLEGGDK